MRRRLLVLVAAVATVLATAGVTMPAQADTRPPNDQDWLLCTGPADDFCIESATANGIATYPGVNPDDGAVVRDYPWVKFVDTRLAIFGAWRDVNGTGNVLDNSVTPGVAYRVVARTGDFNPREMTGKVKNADYRIDRSVTGGWRFTLEFEPTNVHHYGIGPGGCSVYGYCVPNTTRATWDVAGYASGAIEDLIESGMPRSEVIQRTGMFSVSNAQDHHVEYDPDTNQLVVKLANPHLDEDGNEITDGNYSALIPNAYLIGSLNVPDPSTLTANSFVVTKTYGSGSTRVPIGLTVEPGGVRIRIDPISFSKPTYKLSPKPKPPGKPRLVSVTKYPGAARSAFHAPLADGGRKIDMYQARCHKAGGAWKYKFGTRSPITLTSMPPGTVYCQVRAHNAVGWGEFGKAGASRVG